MTYRPHLWVPYPHAPTEAEICSLCGEFETPENAAGDCPETFMDEDLELPADLPPEPEPDDDDELRQGIYPVVTADAAGLKKPVVILAFDRDELATWRAAELPALVETILNYKRAHGYPESICDAYRPGLMTALGAWWDEHFTCTEAMTEAGQLPP
jgi:hypothetical protein